MRIRWLLLGIVSCLVIVLASLPAWTTGLELVPFDRAQNRLEFKVDRPVQPQAYLLADPTRLVIELPGILLDEPTLTQTVGGHVRYVRAVQLNDSTARVIIELEPGYLLDPKQIQFRGLSPTHWTVQLPPPQSITQQPVTVAPSPSPPITSQAVPMSVVASPPETATVINQVQPTIDGLLIQTSGALPNVRMQRSDDQRTLILDFPNTQPAATVAQRVIGIERHGVETVNIVSTPTTTQLMLTLSAPHGEWKLVPSPSGGMLLLPKRAPRINTLPPVVAAPPTATIATIQAVELNLTKGQLLIYVNQPVTPQAQWQGDEYRLQLTPARLASDVRGPQLPAGSPLQRIRLQREDAQTVSIWVLPTAGVRIERLNAVSPQVLALQMRSPMPPAAPPVVTTPPVTVSTNPPRLSVNSLPPPVPPIDQPPSSLPPAPTLPPSSPVPIDQPVVVIDPGHGGLDPGAVGIGGLREKDVVLPIALNVGARLQQQGLPVVLTRVDDRDLDLEPRVQLAEQVRAKLFVSIHANSIGADRPDVNGLETYYYMSGSQLAQTLHGYLLQLAGVRDRGVRQARFYVLRKTSMPAVLIETGYVSGYEDANRLRNPIAQQQIADAIAQGILQYLTYSRS
ncbi:MAG: N-acetylmuramoyl-L-alanine amidase [Cyanobacteria bacterium]|nr:N-acetylmuramoyl-L-alanine amidase [Cyanobacteriota bacterium]MDW8202257.1 N-acetylmuramoyl-L-alanine amidase [Cyanobacteriota bacterium SKYGB_h_bin112]